MKDSVGVGGVQNRQSGCYRRMPFLAPIKGGIRQGAEQFVLHQQVNVRVVPTGHAIEGSVDLAYEIFNRVFRKVPERLNER